MFYTFTVENCDLLTSPPVGGNSADSLARENRFKFALYTDKENKKACFMHKENVIKCHVLGIFQIIFDALSNS